MEDRSSETAHASGIHSVQIASEGCRNVFPWSLEIPKHRAFGSAIHDASRNTRRPLSFRCAAQRVRNRSTDSALNRNFEYPEQVEVDKYYPQFYHKMDKVRHPPCPLYYSS